MSELPKTQQAVQLVGPDELCLNEAKEVFTAGPYQIVGKIEAVGLCFSDLKLLKQFSTHVRKTETLSGIDLEILKEIPSYVPGEAATVPGHEAVVEIVEVGEKVTDVKAGERYLVQTDYRWLKNQTANASFGYNFEGALQEYVLMDTRVITSPEGESMLIPVTDKLSSSAIALVEPWGCVEQAYVATERQSLTAGGRMLVVADVEPAENSLADLFAVYGKPGKITWVSKTAAPKLDVAVTEAADIAGLAEIGFDDIIYFGSDAKKVESLFAKLDNRGLLNIVLCGGKLGAEIDTPVGRCHYGGIRIVGTTGTEAAESMKRIPATDEIRAGDKINVVGAGGPMGMMHVIRNICQGVENVSVFAGDVDDERLEMLAKIAAPIAAKNNVAFKTYNAKTEKIAESFDYVALMAPVPALAAAAVGDCAKGGLINIFAGIPATITGMMDIDSYIEKEIYFIGTSGSTLDDMKKVLVKVEAGQLDTDVSVAAISGLAGAVEGIRAVENRLIAGKIIVYPACKGLGLITLKDLNKKMPEVAACLENGLWTKKAEEKLLEKYL